MVVSTSYAQGSVPLGMAWWVLRHPGWMGTGPRCPELGAATGRLSGCILTLAEDCGYFQGHSPIQTQTLGLPSVRPVDHPDSRRIFLDERTGILTLILSLFLKQ